MAALLLFFWCGATAVTHVQDDEAEKLERIRREARERSAVSTYAFYLTDVHGPRLTGSPAFIKAATWASQTLRDIGLDSVQLLSATSPEWSEPGWAYRRYAVRLVEPEFATLQAIPSPWSHPTPGRLVGEPMQFTTPGRSGLPAEDLMARYKGKLKDKILLLSDQIRPVADAWRPVNPADLAFRRMKEDDLAALRQPPPPQPVVAKPATPPPSPPARRQLTREQEEEELRRFYAFVKAEGALAYLNPTIGDAGTIIAFGPIARPGLQPSPPPGFNVSVESYNRILRLMNHNVPVKLEVELESEFFDDRGHTSVVAEIRGSAKPDEVILAGAHLDSWHVGTGATDNAGNCAVLMEAMRILKATRLPLARTVRIGLWAAEERGLRGSGAYLRQMKERPSERLILYLNADSGSGRIRALQVQERMDFALVADGWLAPFKADGQGFVSVRRSRGSDHVAFEQAGVPTAVFLQDPLYGPRPYHSNMDVYDYLNEDDLRDSAIVVAWVLYRAANEH